MTLNVTGLWEVKAARTEFYSVWTDRSHLGMVFHSLFSIGSGSIDELVCVSPGMATIATFIGRTDLPRGARMVATDRLMSTWVFDGAFWIPQVDSTGNLNQSLADITLAPLHFGLAVFNGGSTNRAVNVVKDTLPVGYRCRLYQLAGGNLHLVPGTGVTAYSAGSVTRTSGAGARALVECIDVNTFVLSGNIF